MKDSKMDWSNINGEQRYAEQRAEHARIHGRYIQCAAPGCRENTWAARETSVTLERWTVVAFPDEMYCPKCRPTPKGPGPASKRCTQCGCLKLLEDFHKDEDSPMGRHSWCKTCVNRIRAGR